MCRLRNPLRQVIGNFLRILFVMLTLMPQGKADQPSSLIWTAEDAVSLPSIASIDISPDGKYTLTQVDYTKFNNGKPSNFSQCVLTNTKSLQTEIIGTSNQSCTQPQFIEEGKKITYLLENGQQKTLYMKAVGSQTVRKIQDCDPLCQRYFFAPNGKSFVFLCIEPQQTPLHLVGTDRFFPIFNLYIQQMDDQGKLMGPAKKLNPTGTNMFGGPLDSIIAWSPDSQKLVFATARFVWKSGFCMTPYLFDLKKNQLIQLDEELNNIYNFHISPDGKNLAYIQPTNYEKHKAPFKPLEELAPPTIQILNLETKVKRSLPDEDIKQIGGWNSEGDALITLKEERTKTNIYSVNIYTQKFEKLQTAETAYIDQLAVSKNSNYLTFIGESLHQPKEIFVSSMTPFSPKKISAFTKETDLSSIQTHPIQWHSFDGLEIEGIIVYPHGYKEGMRVPLIVSVHGGPGVNDSQRFIGGRWDNIYSPAVAAAQGFGTLVVNYRGSSGYGTKFEKLNYQNLGKGDFEDIMIGIDFLITKGIADPENLFIMGGSYGGFMAAWAVGKTNRFRAASVSAGMIDWISDVSASDVPTYFESLFGSFYWEDYNLWRKTSPLRYVTKIETPTLIIHGIQDSRVPKTQSQQLYQALKARNVPVRLVFYLAEGHGADAPIAVVDQMNEVLNWFKMYKISPSLPKKFLNL